MKVKKFEDIVSTKRLRNCSLVLKTISGNKFSISGRHYLYDLYMANEDISKELRFVLSQFEIILRNQLNRVMIKNHGPNWILDFQAQGKWDTKESDSIDTAKSRILDLKKSISHDLLLSKLTLSFWLRLFNPPYFTPYIFDSMKLIFPRNSSALVGRSFGIKDFRDLFGEAKNIRNKVSHQEFILRDKYNLENLHIDLIIVMNMIDKEYYSHFAPRDHFKSKFDDFLKLREAIRVGVEVLKT